MNKRIIAALIAIFMCVGSLGVPTANATTKDVVKQDAKKEIEETVKISKLSNKNFEVKSRNNAKKKDLKVEDNNLKEAFKHVKKEGNARNSEYPVELGNYVYRYLQDAIDDARNGDTIYLHDNVFVSEAVVGNKNITIDLNGHAISTYVGDWVIGFAYANVKLKDGNIFNFGSGHGVIAGESNATLDHVGFYTSDDFSVSIAAGENAIVNVYNSIIVNTEELDTPAKVIGASAFTNAQINLKNCSMDLSKGIGVEVTDNAKGKITDCEIYSRDAYAIYTADSSFISVYGGKYAGYHALALDGGKISIGKGIKNKNAIFESNRIGIAAIEGKRNNVTVRNGNIVSSSDWKVKDKIMVYGDMSKPSSLKVNLYGSYNKIRASWNSVSEASGYAVYYKKGSGSYKLFKRTTSKSVTLSSLSPGYKYTVKVVPYVYGKGYFDKFYGNGTKFTYTSTYTLKKLSIPTVKRSGSNVKVYWKNISGESGYQISKSTSKTKTSIVSTYATTSGSSKLIKATKGKKYYYKVRAYKIVNGKKIYAPWSSVKAYRR